MAKTYNRLEIDVNKKPNSIGIRPVQNDTKSRYLDVCLYENGVAINLTGEQVRITFRKADGGTFFNQGKVTDATAGRCQFALTNEILSEAKAVEAQISVWNAGGEVLSTQVFEIYVSAAIPWTDAVESENEYGVLVVLFQEIQDALDTMHKIAATFGEPGDKAAEYGVDTFWGILEMLAGRGDVESATEKIMSEKIKAYLNSAIGTSSFLSLDKMIQAHGTQTFTEDGTFTVPVGVTKILITAAAGGQAGGTGGRYHGTTNGITEEGGFGGNGGDCILKKAFNVTPGQKISITVGKGGTTRGAIGTSTVIGSLITLAGGNNERSGSNNGGGSGGHGYGYDSETKKYIPAMAGQDGLLGPGGGTVRLRTGSYNGGGGGGSIGNGGNGATINVYNYPTETNGVMGGGGGGGYRDDEKTFGKGGDGIVIIEW